MYLYHINDRTVTFVPTNATDEYVAAVRKIVGDGVDIERTKPMVGAGGKTFLWPTPCTAFTSVPVQSNAEAIWAFGGFSRACDEWELPE